VGKTYTAPDGKIFRPSLFVTPTCPSYGRVGEDRAPADPAACEYDRAARDALAFFAALFDRGSQVTSAATCALASGNAVTAHRAWSPHNCRHSPWRSTHVGPAGQVSCIAGCGWGFEADLIPAHSPMMSRTTMIDPIPNHRFTGFLGGSGDRFGGRCASR
jgi:hypothetical protein